MAKLLIQESNGAREFELVDLEVAIGRELDNALRLADPSISRHHAVLRRQGAAFEIQDLGSSNGVLLNGVRTEKGTLKDGDRITLGQMQITFVDPAPASPLGTVRMNLADMAKAQALPPEPAGTQAFASIPAPAPQPAATQPPPPQPAAPPVVSQPPAPAPGPAAAAAPGFLQPYLPAVPDTAQPILAGGGIERGDFVTRMVAFLLDLAPFCVLVVLHMVIASVMSDAPVVLAFLGSLVSLALGLAYLAFQMWCLVAFRATLGKKIQHLRVVPETHPTSNIDWTMALLRLAGHLVNTVFLGLPTLLILGAERKGLEDLLSGSVVIKVDR